MKLPAVLLGNRGKLARELEAQFPARVGALFSPEAYKIGDKRVPYALDNGRFAVWSAGKTWSEPAFDRMLEKAGKFTDNPPLWLSVPDVVADAAATLREWRRWARALAKHGWPLAVVVQDGMVPADVVGLRPTPDVVFVGGTTRWKLRSMRQWSAAFPRVHVGRVNSKRRLWQVHRAGCESSDGTGWWRPDKKLELIKYLAHSGRGLPQHGIGRLLDL